MRWRGSNKRSKAVATSSATGKHYEDVALRYLQRHGLSLVERNYRCRCGELDLLMLEGDTLVFVEVKFRKRHGHGHSVEQVTRRKREKLLNSAQLYLASHRQYHNSPCRFDIVGITASAAGDSVQWIKSAIEYN